AARGHLAGQLARLQQHRVLAAAHRQRDLEAFGIDEVGLGGQADEVDRVAAEKELRGEQRSVGRPQEENGVSHVPALGFLRGGERGGWMAQASRKRRVRNRGRCWAPSPLDRQGIGRKRRTARKPKTTIRISSATCATRKGGSDWVGASALKKETFWKVCTTS